MWYSCVVPSIETISHLQNKEECDTIEKKLQKYVGIAG